MCAAGPHRCWRLRSAWYRQRCPSQSPPTPDVSRFAMPISRKSYRSPRVVVRRVPSATRAASIPPVALLASLIRNVRSASYGSPSFGPRRVLPS